MTPTAELIDASGHHGSIASSMASSSSASSSDGVENVTLCPRLNQCIYVKEIPEDQAVAAKDEASRFISRGDLDYMVQLTHVIPKRPSNGPLVFALRVRNSLQSLRLRALTRRLDSYLAESTLPDLRRRPALLASEPRKQPHPSCVPPLLHITRS
ncbi:hypothetical protein BJY59DRAFT_584050 [Rhodotorula toruloides]